MFKSTALVSVLFFCLQASAQKTPEPLWNLHFQATYIYQYKPPFHSPYSGKNSLIQKREEQNSLTATLYAGLKLWKGAAVFVNPELAGGSGLSGALGMGGSTNGETFRVGNPAPTLYLARAYLQQTFAIGNTSADVHEEANEIGGNQPSDFLQLRAGKYSLGDLFDNNEFSNSPRTQFMNWSLMNNGAWDYAANVRGYTYALAAWLKKGDYNFRAALSSLPKEANGSELSTSFNKTFALNMEAGREFKLNDKPGNIRLLYFMNKAPMGNYDQSIRAATIPDIVSTRKDGRMKHGFGINADQRLSDDAGIFLRGGWNDGKNETWCFTEIDHTIATGYCLNGNKWKRKDDIAGLAFVSNGLSDIHTEYLSKGGNGFILGDGKLNYSPEYIAELYYSWRPSLKDLWLTADYQLAINPGYNKDRGPVNVFSIRLHAEL